jgi:peptidoglycan/xylan/chitin deacetylase (PgdA/CDA1 family)
LGAESISTEQAQPSARRLFLLYHELRREPARYSYVTSTALFEQHVELYARVRGAADGGLWPEVTFDDGHVSNIEMAAPVLESHGLTATFFITVGWTGARAGYMDWGDLRALHAAGHSIGAHGWSHTLLTHSSDRELETELGRARLTLQDRLGTAITAMSLPGGRCNPRVLAKCRTAGYARVYTSMPKAEPRPLGPMVGRMNVRGDMQAEWLARLLAPESGVLAGLERRQRLKDAANGQGPVA